MNRANRKKQLIAQGAFYRMEALLSKQALNAGLQPNSLVKGALQQFALTAFAAFRNRNSAGLPGVDLQTLLPLALSGLSALYRKKPLRGMLLRGALFAGAAATVAAVAAVAKKKRSANEEGGTGGLARRS